MTWAYDRFTALPYLRFLGEPGTGKSRLEEICTQLCYRAFPAGGSITAASLFRSINRWKGTLILDEADYKSSASWSEIVKVLNQGYMKGKPVIRCGTAEEDYAEQAFDVFGPKVIANRSRFEDKALETRCLTLQMVKRPLRDSVPRQLPHTFSQDGERLRNRLLQWRFDNWFRIVPDEARLLDLDPRLAQIGTPLYTVADDPAFRDWLLEYLTRYGKEQIAESGYALVVAVLDDLLGDRPHEWFSAGTIAKRIQDMRNPGTLDLLDFANSDCLSAQRVGYLLSALAFPKKHTRVGNMLLVSREKIEALKRAYPLSDDVPVSA